MTARIQDHPGKGARSVDRPTSARTAAACSPAAPKSRAIAPAYLALRDGLRRFVARRVRSEYVDDLAQDILMRMHERAAELRDDTRLAGWAFRIAQTVVADHHRAHARERSFVDSDRRSDSDISGTEDELLGVEGDEAGDEGNVNEIVAGWLRPMLALLPDEYEEAVEWVDVQGMSQKAYAERAGLSASGARSRVQRGRRMLQEMVLGCCDLELDARGNVIGYERRTHGR